MPEALASGALDMIPGVGKLLKPAFENAMDRRRYRLQETAKEIAEAVGADRLMSRAAEHPELEDLLVHALEAALASSYEAKRRLLARAVVNAYLDDDAIDPSTVKVLALAQLEPVHLRALVKIRTWRRALAVTHDDEGKLRDEVYRASLKLPSLIIYALIQTGCAQQYMSNPGVFDTTIFGDELLEELRGAGDETWLD
jgi:hypothetical protein